VRSIGYSSEKGGVVKTGSAVLQSIILAIALATLKKVLQESQQAEGTKSKKPVVLFDLDPQAQAGQLLGYPRDSHTGPMIKDVILEETIKDENRTITLQDIIKPTYIDQKTARFVDITQFEGEVVQGPDYVPITLDANTLDFDMKSKLPYWPERMAEIMQQVQDIYEYAVFDLPPGLLAPTMSTYAALDYLAFPMTPDTVGVAGFQGALRAMQRTQSRNKKLRAAGAYFTRVHTWVTDKEVMKQVQQLIQASGLDIPLLEAIIPESKDHNESITHDGSLVVLSRPGSKCARAHWYVLHALLERIGGPAQPVVQTAVLKMKQEDEQLATERKTSKTLVQKGV
jgi:cellulose biosynthesis protein BcsQ